jgi:HSP20 family protein
MANEPQKTEKTTQTSQQDQRSQSREMTTQQQADQRRGMTTRRPSRLTRGQGAVPFSPFSLMRRMFEDLERMALFATTSPENMPRPGGALAWIPDIDVTRRDDKIVVSVDLPGLAPDDVRVMVEDDAIIIEGERRYENVREEGDVWQAERTYGRFRRVIPLPEGAQPESAEARFENGVLEVAVRAPETGGTKGRNLEIKGGNQPQSGSQQKPGNGGRA